LHLPPKKVPRLFVKTFFGNKPVSDSDSDSDSDYSLCLFSSGFWCALIIICTHTQPRKSETTEAFFFFFAIYGGAVFVFSSIGSLSEQYYLIYSGRINYNRRPRILLWLLFNLLWTLELIKEERQRRSRLTRLQTRRYFPFQRPSGLHQASIRPPSGPPPSGQNDSLATPLRVSNQFGIAL